MITFPGTRVARIVSSARMTSARTPTASNPRRRKAKQMGSRSRGGCDLPDGLRRARAKPRCAHDSLPHAIDQDRAAACAVTPHSFWTTLRDQTARLGTTVVFSTHYLQEADEQAARIVLLGGGRLAADGTAEQIKRAAGAGRAVRFCLLHGEAKVFAEFPAVTSVQTDGNHVTLHSADSDATLWALHPHRRRITGILVIDASLEDAFLTLVRPPPEQSGQEAPHRAELSETA
ncbi:MAG: hypothetical protein ACRDL5_16385 [Solirubrobacteraceae bacterium]